MIFSDTGPVGAPQSRVVGQWRTVQCARAARIIFVTAIRRGLGSARAIKLARELTEDPVASVLGGSGVAEWLAERYDARPACGWSVEISRCPSEQWLLRIVEEPIPGE